MESGRLYNKAKTALHGSGVTNSGSTVQVETRLTPTSVATTSQNPHMVGEDDSHRTLTGPGMGVISGGPGKHTQKWGHRAQSGSQITIDDTPGGETISLIHHSGAGIVVEPDGSVFFSSTSKRGAGLSAPLGDVYIQAGGEIVIDGPGSISIKTAGDLNLEVGGTLNIVASAIKTTTKALDETIDGYSTRSVTNDQSLIVGGINRTTVAGDQRMQVAGTDMLDVGGVRQERVDGNRKIQVKGNYDNSVAGKTKIHTTGDAEYVSNGKGRLNSTGALDVGTSDKMLVSASSDITVSAGGDLDAGATGDAGFTSGGETRISGGSIRSTTTGTNIMTGSTSTVSGSEVRLATGTVIGPIPSGSSPAISGQKDAVPARGSVTSASEAEAADFPAANDVVDNLTTVRKYPEYPGNGKLESAAATAYGQIDHDKTPQADEVYNEETSGNQGNMNPSTVGDSIDTLPEDPVNRDPNIEASDPGIGVPSRHDTSAKISKYFTLGALTRAHHSKAIPAALWESVVKNHILAAYNVLDPIKEKFPDIIITSAYRPNSRNHKTGRAIDMVVGSRSLTRHAEIARYVRDNLPVDQVFLERNDSGRTHVHIRVSESGQKTSSPTVLTCGDKLCKSRTSGINVEWLKRKM